MNFSYSDFKGQYFVFIGQNASTGKPHPTTGSMSFFGYFITANDKDHANRIAEHHYSPYSSNLCVVGTAQTLRKYSLGCSVQMYLVDLYMSQGADID